MRANIKLILIKYHKRIKQKQENLFFKRTCNYFQDFTYAVEGPTPVLLVLWEHMEAFYTVYYYRLFFVTIL